MLQVEIIEHDHSSFSLQQELNEKLKCFESKGRVIDIKFNTTVSVSNRHTYYAMIIYEPYLYKKGY